jgi:hypothetical protein
MMKSGRRRVDPVENEIEAALAPGIFRTLRTS